ncbi:ATP-binding protein [Niveibacterium sp. SC-1]|uniref:sensor histidine kinase n=1 Tax=Niveibacterium sp. SC-1 TaxID=3135646 RepID=UPI00311EEAE7
MRDTPPVQMLDEHAMTALASWPSLGLLALSVGMFLLALLLWRRHRQAEAMVTKVRAELAHASRLITVGELTGSIAHEINQPLGAILSNVEAAEILLSRPVPAVDEVREILADIRNDDLRASKVVKQIRALLAKAELELTPLLLNDVVKEAMVLGQAFMRRERIRASQFLEPDLPPVLGDSTQLQQVLLNLLLNAAEAMYNTPPALRTIELRTEWRDGEILCAVLDSGPGFAGQALARAFDSFFTTKPDGVGLGLSIVQGIVERHGGRIRISNRVEGGACVQIFLPALTE